MSNKKTNFPFNPHEKPQGMSDEEWRGIDNLIRLDLKITAIKAFYTRQERAVEEEATRPIEPLTKAKPPKVGYVARELVLLNLPYSKPDGDVWTRKNGHLSLIVQGGYKLDRQTGKPINIGVPYGATARLVLFYIMSVAAFSETRKIYLGNSFDAFLKTIGASPERRGVKTGARAVLNQLERLIRDIVDWERLKKNQGAINIVEVAELSTHYLAHQPPVGVLSWTWKLDCLLLCK